MVKRKQSKKTRTKRLLKKADRHSVTKNTSKKTASLKTYTGTFDASSQGYGFIIADAGLGMDADIFVPAKHVKDAVKGDRVSFTVSVYNGRPEAHIKEILSRGTETFTGVYRYRNRREGNRITASHVVIPDNKKLCFDTFVPPAHLCGAKDGDKVLCRITSYPDTTNQTSARGVIEKVYGDCEQLYPNVYAIIDSYGLRTEFPAAVTEESEVSSKRRVLKKSRLDLTKDRIFTIDGASSKDFDDAISVKKTDSGFILGVHIADVSEYVKEGSATDDEAFLRGTSVYFADKVIPMLPTRLSNGACSLSQNVNRYTLSAFISIDKNGEITDCKIAESVIRSKVRGVYSEVNDVIENGEKSKFNKKYAPVFGNGGLEDVLELYNALKSKSGRRHALELDSAEVCFEISQDGQVENAYTEERGVSERIIEQFMLAANEAVASLLLDRDLPCVYRVHGSPDPEKLQQLKAFAESVGIDASSLDGEITLASTEKFLQNAKEKGKGEIFSYLLLRCMMKAKYSRNHSPHFGLGAQCYCHFTSPIRRYPDLTVHRMIKTLLLHGDTESERRLESLCYSAADQSNICEDRATKTERDMDDLYMAAFSRDMIGQEFDAVITGTVPFGFFARLPYGAEGFVRLPAVNLEYVPSLFTLITPSRTYRPGDTVMVRISEVNLNDRRIELNIV